MARSNKFFWKQDKFWGLSDDSRSGNPGSFRYGIGADVRGDTGRLQVAKKPVRDDGEIIDKEVHWIEENPQNGDCYLYAEDTIYRESSGVYTAAHVLSTDSPNGQGLREFDGNLYYRTATKLGKYDYVTWNDSFQTGLESCIDWSMMCRFLNMMLVGHGRYVATLDDIGTWTVHRLTLPPGYNVRSIFRSGSYAVILATRGTNIATSEEGYMFLWDGTSETYNDSTPLTGNPHAGISYRNKIMLIAGGEAQIQESLGGIADPIINIPDVSIGQTVEVYPGAIDTWRNLVHFGLAGGDADQVVRAVYTYGKKKNSVPDALNAEYPASHGGFIGTGYGITAIKKIGSTIRFAWKNGSTYGVDEVDINQYQSQAVIRTLAFDGNSPYEKVGFKLMIELAGKLKTGESITGKMSTEPYDDPTFTDPDSTASNTLTTVGEKKFELPLTVNDVPMRSQDLHAEIALAGTGSTRPAVKRMWVELDEESDQL